MYMIIVVLKGFAKLLEIENIFPTKLIFNVTPLSVSINFKDKVFLTDKFAVFAYFTVLLLKNQLL